MTASTRSEFEPLHHIRTDAYTYTPYLSPLFHRFIFYAKLQTTVQHLT